MKNIITLLFAGCIFHATAQNTFAIQQTAINNFFYPAMDTSDYDNDGDLDIVISGGLDTTGDFYANVSNITIYENDNGVYTALATPNIYGLHLGAVKFVDIDNDGDQDLIATGQNYTDITTYFFTVYENDNSVFTVKQQLEGTIYSSLDAGDYDNDGDLDLLLTGAFQAHDGASILTKIYTNTNGTFADANITLPPVQNGNAQFADFDNDQDLDILIMGTDTDSNYILKTFFNDNASFTEQQALPGMYLGGFTLGDYDNDGDLDFAVMGDDSNDDYAAKIYTNTNGSFTELTSLTGVDNSSGPNPIAWGDYDNDGDLDLVISGTDADYNDVTHLYRNTNNTFSLVQEGLKNVGGNTGLNWLDYDNDNDLDILISGFHEDQAGNYVNTTVLHKNETTVTNAVPDAPQNLSAVFNQNTLTLSWNNASDDHTATNGLYYWLTLGTTVNGSEIASYPVYGTTWTIKNLPSATYYWSVQSIDTSFKRSAKATNQVLSTESFVLNQLGVTLYPNPSIDKNITVSFTAQKQNDTAYVVIYNASGKQLFSRSWKAKSGCHKKAIDLTGFSSGLYIMEFHLEDGKTITKKLVLN